MAEIKVTSQQLRTTAEQLRGLNGQFKSQVENVDAQEKTLISKWEGDARDAFNNAYNNDKVQWDNFYNLIEQYCVTLENIAAEYDNKEAINQGIASTRSH